MKQAFRFIMVAVSALLLAGQAHAVSYVPETPSYGMSDLLQSDSAFLLEQKPGVILSLSGSYNFTYLGSESRDWNIMFETEEGFDVVFSNRGSTKTTVGMTANNLDISSLYFWDLSRLLRLAPVDTWAEAVNIYQLKSDVIVNNVKLFTGMYVIGFNDNLRGDKDYDDMLVAVSSVPLPGAAVFLLSGLLGLVGLRRRQMV